MNSLQRTPPPQDQFAQAMQYMQAGNAAGAQVLLEQIVAATPANFQALHFLGVSYAMTGRMDKADELIRKSLALKPDYAEAVLNLGNVLQSQNRFAEAIDCYKQAIALQPQFFQPCYTLALLLENLDRLEEALAYHDKVIGLQPDFVPAYTNRGVVLAKLNRHNEALASHEAAIARAPGFADAHTNRGDTLRALNRLPEALASYDGALAIQPKLAYAHRRRAEVLEAMARYDEALASCDRWIELEPNVTEAHYIRGNVLHKQRDYPQALASFERAIELDPAAAQVHNERGLVLEKMDRLEEALASYDKVVELEPDFAIGFYNRGNVLCQMDKPTQARADYEKALQLRPDYALAKSNLFWLHIKESSDYALIERLGVEAYESMLKSEVGDPWYHRISNFRLIHDLEQIDYLLGHGFDFDGLERAQRALRDVQSRHMQDATSSDTIQVIDLSDAEVAEINLFRNALFRYQIAGPPARCLNQENDWRAIEERYFSSYPEMIYIDNLLAPDALEQFRLFCLTSVVWKREYINQYLGAFANMGFISPLHLQIATELQQTMPRIFGYKLEQLWAYKYNSRLSKGINVHADVAITNLNFWVTPDEANLDPDSGGLVVYEVPPPSSWSFEQYNADEKRIYEFLEKNRSGSMKVPYRCNRAVLFNSALFHETDEIHFREGYENRRINVTYLFGRGLKTA